jgi:hypothetical protein
LTFINKSNQENRRPNKNKHVYQAMKSAFKGLIFCFKSEANVRRHGVLCLGVIGMGFYFSISSLEWCLCMLCIGSVMAAEYLNTAIEELTNLVEPNSHPIAGRVKEISAGAVLFLSIISVIVGNIIFLPKFILLF